MSPRDVEFTPNGLTVLDPANGRLALVTPAGKIAGHIPLSGVGHAEQFVPLNEGGYLLVTMRPDSPLVVIDDSGQFLSRHPVGWPRYRELHPLAAQVISASSPDSRYGVIGLRFGEVFFVLNTRSPEEPLVPVTYVEPVTAPALRPQVVQGDTTYILPLMPMSAADLSVTEDRVLVLAEGRTRFRNRQLDVYSLPDGHYLHTLILPRTVSMIAAYEGEVHVAYDAGDGHCYQRLRPVPPLDTPPSPR